MYKELHKFNEVFKIIPAKKKAMTIISFKDSFMFGLFNEKRKEDFISTLKGKKINRESLNTIYKFLSKKYDIQALQYIDEDDLMKTVDNLWHRSQEDFQNIHYHTQIKKIRECLFSSQVSQKKTFLYGDKNQSNYIPESSFLLNIFNSKSSQSFLEKKNLILGLINETHSAIELMMLSFKNQELFSFSSIGKEEIFMKEAPSNFLKRNIVKRVLSELKSTYGDSFYGIFTTKSIWIKCIEKQKGHGEKAAWRYFLRRSKGKNNREFLLIEPNSWALRANMLLKSIF